MVVVAPGANGPVIVAVTVLPAAPLPFQIPPAPRCHREETCGSVPARRMHDDKNREQQPHLWS